MRLERGVFDHGLFDCEFHDVFGEHVAKQTPLVHAAFPWKWRWGNDWGGGNATLQHWAGKPPKSADPEAKVIDNDKKNGFLGSATTKWD